MRDPVSKKLGGGRGRHMMSVSVLYTHEVTYMHIPHKKESERLRIPIMLKTNEYLGNDRMKKVLYVNEL